MRRNHDSLNPTSHPDIMTLSSNQEDISDAHPYKYARIIGIYHAVVSIDRAPSQRMDFLHVRWFYRDRTFPSGWIAKRLPRLSFISADEEGAFGFLDPAEVVRASHIMPAFAHERTSEFLSIPSPLSQILRNGFENEKEWKYYYVGM